MSDVMGKVHSFESFGTLDGPGLRFIIFLQGCPFRCLHCHNPDTWDPEGGREVGTKEVISRITRCRSYLRNGGATISGGEPLFQPDFTLALLQGLKAERIHTALDTSGLIPLDRSAPVIDAADMLLLDIKALDADDCLKLSGGRIENTLATLDYCEKTGKRVWIRHVVVPGLTLDHEKLKALGDHLAPFSCVERVELLPFSKLGESKWSDLGIDYALEPVPAPTPEQMDAAQRAMKK
ncbi:MAG: pyruvate formate-lyase-activating protein [Kiritimatiellia bacterium]|jgi:pyruvate formate lyase activating enzyme